MPNLQCQSTDGVKAETNLNSDN